MWRYYCYLPCSLARSMLFSLLLITALTHTPSSPHLQRSQPDNSTEIKLFEYPGAVGEDMTPVATIALEQPRYGHEPEGLYYEFEWEEPDRVSRPAKATRVGESGYDQLVATLKHVRLFSCISGISNA